MRKSRLSLIIVTIVILSSGCNWTDVHTHSFRHVADSESTCTTKGYIEHWECQECHNVYTKKGCASESTKEAVGKDLLPHDFVYTAGSPSSCIEKGMKEHWECSYCNKLVLDENGDVEGSRDELELEDYGPHKPTNHEAGRAATCTASGLREHWICEVCNGIFLDANAENGTTEEGLVIDMLPHTLTHHDLVASTCIQTGMKEYWDCAVCKKIFLDAEANSETNADDLVLDMLPHTLTHHDRVAPTCIQTGMKEYWDCAVCKKIFLDAEANSETNADDLVLDMLPHTLTHHDLVAPTCIQTGMKEYWDCAVCKKIFLDAEANSETNADDLVLDMLPHTLTHHDLVAPTCIQTGMKEYWDCAVCKKIFLDAEANSETNADDLVLDMLPHTLTHHDIVAPTCTSTGIKEHWICEVCNGIFLDANAENGTTEEGLVLDMLPHEYKDENGYWTEEGGNTVYRNTCINCGALLKTAPIGTVGPAGGYIFYVEEDSGHDLTYYENSPSVLKNVCFGYYRTSPNGAPLTVETSDSIGSGKENTRNLVSAMGSAAYTNPSDDALHNAETTADYSAKICDDYSVTVNGKVFDDWFLPSKLELGAYVDNILAHNDKYTRPIFKSWALQTSTLYLGNMYHRLAIADCSFGYAPNSIDHGVLPVRSFNGGNAL